MTTRKYELYGNDGSYIMESENIANSKKWCAEVKEIERETGKHFNRYYSSQGGRLHLGYITSWRFNWN